MSYAVITAGGKQHKVAVGDRIRVEKIKAGVGDKVTFDEVLALQTEGALQIGRPVLKGARVVGRVVEQDKAKKVLDYLLSDKGQAIWTNAYLRPARPIDLPEAVKKKFLPDSDYARAKNVDWGQMENMQKGFVDRYLAEVR